MSPPVEHAGRIEGWHQDEATLHAYLDSELTEDEGRLVAAHLATCPRCAARAEGLRTLFGALEALPEAALTRDLAPAVVETLRRESDLQSALPRRRLWWLAPQAIAAALLLAFALPILSATWSTEAGTALGAVGLGVLTAELEIASAEIASPFVELARATGDRLAAADRATQTALAPYAHWPAATWGGLLLALLPLWWLANRWLLRVGPPSTTARGGV